MGITAENAEEEEFRSQSLAFLGLTHSVSVPHLRVLRVLRGEVVRFGEVGGEVEKFGRLVFRAHELPLAFAQGVDLAGAGAPEEALVRRGFVFAGEMRDEVHAVVFFVGGHRSSSSGECGGEDIERRDGRVERRRGGEFFRPAHDEGQEAAFHVDHIHPVAEGGEAVLENLALACVSCSLRKGARSHSRDPQTGRDAALFHPRRHGWQEHFAWKGYGVIGLTATARATVDLLKMNRALIVAIRAEERLHGRHPPKQR